MLHRPVHSCLAALSLLLAGGCGGGDDATGPAARRPGDPPPFARVDQHEQLKEDLARPRHPADGGGRGWLEPTAAGPAAVAAGALGTWTVRYAAGPLGIAAGGALYFMPEPFWGWSPPQGDEPAAPGFCVVDAGAAAVEVTTLPIGMLEIRFPAGLPAASEVEIEYGAGPARARADRYAERDARLWLAVDGDGDGVRKIVAESPRLIVTHGPPALLALTLASTARPGDEVRLTAAVLDPMANVCTDFAGTIELERVARDLGLPERIALSPADRGARTVAFTAAREGILRLRGRLALEQDVLEAESNPLWVAAGAPPILWGDLHGHSNFSDGTGLPEDYLRYARDVAALDVAALTDHDHFGVRFLDAEPALWDEIKRATEQAHDPGRFVALLGFEWTSWLHGHRHVLYFDDSGAVISSLDPAAETPELLWRRLAGSASRALTFAHHSAGEPVPTDWSFRPDPRFEPVTEVVSVHGSSEAQDAPRPVRGGIPGNFVRDVLERGDRLGFIGSGDSHDGHPGLAHLSMGYGAAAPTNPGGRTLGTGGVAALLTAERTRDGVMAALLARRCYATSGPRILLQVDLAGHGMGEAVEARSLPAEPALELLVIGTAPLERLDLIRHRKGVASRTLDGGREFTASIPLDDLEPGDFLYVRVSQQDGGAAWSSPMFIK